MSNKKNILIIDDFEPTLNLFKVKLSKQHNTAFANSIRQAEVFLKAIKMDIVFCDLTMETRADDTISQIIKIVNESRFHPKIVFMSTLDKNIKGYIFLDKADRNFYEHVEGIINELDS